MIFEVDEKSLNNIQEVIKNKILIPKLNEISDGVRNDIADTASSFRGVSSPSIAQTAATSGIPDKKRLSVRIEPIEPKAEVFWINKYGYENNQMLFVDDKPGLREWVKAKYGGIYKQQILDGWYPLRIRKKGKATQLGSPLRDFFGIGFRKLLAERNKYGLR